MHDLQVKPWESEKCCPWHYCRLPVLGTACAMGAEVWATRVPLGRVPLKLRVERGHFLPSVPVLSAPALSRCSGGGALWKPGRHRLTYPAFQNEDLGPCQYTSKEKQTQNQGPPSRAQVEVIAGLLSLESQTWEHSRLGQLSPHTNCHRFRASATDPWSPTVLEAEV
jgi:hypothetical protein